MPPPLLPDKIEDELEMTMVCHRPEGLEQLEAQTNFTKRELQVLYRGFKNVRPTRGSEAWCDFPQSKALLVPRESLACMQRFKEATTMNPCLGKKKACRRTRSQ